MGGITRVVLAEWLIRPGPELNEIRLLPEGEYRGKHHRAPVMNSVRPPSAAFASAPWPSPHLGSSEYPCRVRTVSGTPPGALTTTRSSRRRLFTPVSVGA